MREKGEMKFYQACWGLFSRGRNDLSYANILVDPCLHSPCLHFEQCLNVNPRMVTQKLRWAVFLRHMEKIGLYLVCILWKGGCIWSGIQTFSLQTSCVITGHVTFWYISTITYNILLSSHFIMIPCYYNNLSVYNCYESTNNFNLNLILDPVFT